MPGVYWCNYKLSTSDDVITAPAVLASAGKGGETGVERMQRACAYACRLVVSRKFLLVHHALCRICFL